MRSVISHRVRNYEFGHFVTTLSIIAVLPIPVWDVPIRVSFAFLLNLLYYLSHDYFDLERDRESNRTTEKTDLLTNNLFHVILLQVIVVSSCIFIALFWNLNLLIPFMIAFSTACLYSKYFKEFPILDLVSIGVWGGSLILVAFPIGLFLGWYLAGLISIYTAGFHAVQVLRDYEEDDSIGVMTTAVKFGPSKTLFIGRLIWLLGFLYVLLFIHWYFAFVFSFMIFLGSSFDRIEEYWFRLRILFGVGWSCILGWILFYGDLNGLI